MIPSESLHPTLFWQDSDGEERPIVQDRDRITIGRQDSDVVILDPAVPRNHAYIDRVEGSYRMLEHRRSLGLTPSDKYKKI